MISKLLFIVLFCLYLRQISGHGMMMDPPNRSSLWRFYKKSPTNYNDNQNFCGGRAVQWDLFDGKCGVCGDRYDDPHPQANENTGLYGRGTVVGVYKSGSEIDVTIRLTANHKGTFTYSLCTLDDPNIPESGEDCFHDLVFADGTTHYNVSSTDSLVINRIVLPYGLKCDRCVLRWHYRAGNSWGFCDDGTSGLGCGPQETFRSCSDIKIV